MTTPILFAFAAGMIATVNPCGFAMLPAYVSMFLGSDEDSDVSGGVWAGLRVALAVTVGFLALFGLVGALLSAGLWGIVTYVPWIALIIGAALFALGIAVLRGFHLTTRVLNVKASNKKSFFGMAGFGVAYGAASISCTLPIFLSVVGLSTSADDAVSGLAVFLAYAAGMGMVLTVIAVALVTSQRLMVDRMRSILPYVERIGGWLLIASGLFIVYYWGVALSVDPGQETILYGPIVWVDRISAWFTLHVSRTPLLWGSVLAVAIVLLIGNEYRRARRRRESERVAS